ncbi:MAG: hypothetical protein J5758_01825, partial [Abditibacteriota bacterium]|nr:hypothetical protein [Abditibacteriota bacterium]
ACIEMKGGRGVIQGNSFSERTPQIVLDSGVRSAIVTGNMCPSGVKVDNRIGSKAQIALNSPGLPDAMTAEQRKNYVVDVGSSHDGTFLTGFNPGDEAAEFRTGGTKRWSGKDCRITLPVNKNTRYTVTFSIFVPEPAWEEGCGMLLDGRLALPVKKAGENNVYCVVDSGSREELAFTPRFRYWSPRETYGSADGRTLGIALREIKVVSDPENRLFSANIMDYME